MSGGGRCDLTQPSARLDPRLLPSCTASPTARGPAPGPLAFDFTVINALGPNHRDATFAAPAGAAAAYVTHKRRHQRTEALRREAGVTYHPEAQGGMSTEAAALLHRLADVVSSVEGAAALTICNRLFDQLGVAIARGNGRSIRRRREAQLTLRCGQSALILAWNPEPLP